MILTEVPCPVKSLVLGRTPGPRGGAAGGARHHPGGGDGRHRGAEDSEGPRPPRLEPRHPRQRPGTCKTGEVLFAACSPLDLERFFIVVNIYVDKGSVFFSLIFIFVVT